MAKKIKRQVSSTEASVESGSDRSSASSLIRPSTSFNPDYSLVIKDLKRIGILGGSFFVILLILSFIIK